MDIMDILIIAFTLAIVVCAICLIAVVLMQSSKSSGLGETFGGSTQAFASRATVASKEKKLQRLSIVLGIVIAVLAIAVAIFTRFSA